MRLRKRKRRDGETSFFIDYREGGQRRQEFLPFITRERAKREFNSTPLELARLSFYEFQGKKARGERGLPTEPGLTLGAALDHFLEVKEASVGPSQLTTLKTFAKQIKERFGATTPARTLTLQRVNDFVAWRRKPTKKRKADAPPTINKKLALLKAAVELAIQEGRLGGENSLAGMELLSDRREEVWRWLREDEIAALLAVLRDGAKVKVKRRRNGDYETTLPAPKGLLEIVTFLLNTGARRGEALALRWRDVDFERGLVRLLTTKRATKGRPATARFIPINATCRELLEGMGPGKADARVFAVSADNLRRKFERVCELAGIGHCRIHDLRHTFASHLAMNGTPLNTIRELLGHSSLDMTLRYAHLCPEATADAVGTLNFGGADRGARIVAVGAVADDEKADGTG